VVGPAERCGSTVVVIDEGDHPSGQVVDRSELPPAQQAPLQDGEEQFHLVEPRGLGRGEMQVDPRVVFLDSGPRRPRHPGCGTALAQSARPFRQLTAWSATPPSLCCSSQQLTDGASPSDLASSYEQSSGPPVDVELEAVDVLHRGKRTDAIEFVVVPARRI
jgi:hypothetical protein